MLEKSASLQLTRSEVIEIKNGQVPKSLESSGYTLTDLKDKVEAKEYDIQKGRPNDSAALD